MSITKEQKKTLSMKLKELRLLTDMNQDEIAREFYVTRECWSNYETGKRVPSLDTINKIAKRFSLNVECLIGNEEISEDVKSMIARQSEVYSAIKKDGCIDISELSIADKMSLVDYYKFLKWKSDKKK